MARSGIQAAKLLTKRAGRRRCKASPVARRRYFRREDVLRCKDIFAKLDAQRIAREQEAKRSEAPPVVHLAPESPPSANKYWLSAGSNASALFLFPDTDDVLAPVLRVGAGYHIVRLDLGAVVRFRL